MLSPNKISPRKCLSLRSAKRREIVESVEDVSPSKRTKATSTEKKVNFMKACKLVSYEAYKDARERFQLLYVPDCIDTCTHKENTMIKQISSKAENIFKTEMDNFSWCGALEVCFINITPLQYLSKNILKDIVAIILNANEDLATEYTIEYLLTRCQQALTLHFNMHPPCQTNVRACYMEFLISPMEKKIYKSNTKHKEYYSGAGIVDFCFNRLLKEMSPETSDESFTAIEDVPKELENSVKSLHWRKENHETFEFLTRNSRIERLMMVLGSLVDMLQCDLAICISRASGGKRIRTLMSSVTRGDKNEEIQFSRCVLKVFVYSIHLQYPEEHIKILTLWVNTLVQAFYMSEALSDTDYPEVTAKTSCLSKEFYEALSTVPAESASQVIERIQPYFMQHLVGVAYIKKNLKIHKINILRLVGRTLEYLQSNQHAVQKKCTHLKRYKERDQIVKGTLTKYLSKICESYISSSRDVVLDAASDPYPRMTDMDSSINGGSPEDIDTESVEGIPVEIYYITLIAFLEAYSVKKFYKTVISLNENLQNSVPGDEEEDYNTSNYIITDHIINSYNYIVKDIRHLEEQLKYKTVEPLKTILDDLRGADGDEPLCKT